jgi:hypothetical protein
VPNHGGRVLGRLWNKSRRRLRQSRDTRRTAGEALRLATETSRALEQVLQREIELKRELAELREASSEQTK